MLMMTCCSGCLSAPSMHQLRTFWSKKEIKLVSVIQFYSFGSRGLSQIFQAPWERCFCLYCHVCSFLIYSEWKLPTLDTVLQLCTFIVLNHSKELRSQEYKYIVRIYGVKSPGHKHASGPGADCCSDLWLCQGEVISHVLLFYCLN